MTGEMDFFIASKDIWRDGFFIPVRNSFNKKIEREFLPIELKQAYLNNWGETILSDQEFLDWYCREKAKADKLFFERQRAKKEDSFF